MSSDLKNSFIETAKEKGLAKALGKTAGYLIFLIKKNKADRCKKENTIINNNLELFCHRGKAKLFWAGVEFTKNVGLNTSIRVKDKWVNSSQADWQVQRIGDAHLKVVTRWKGLPISQVWNLKFTGANTIDWQVEMIVHKTVEIDEKKSGIMISDIYTTWITASEEGEFPVLMYWQDIFLKDIKCKRIGLKSRIVDKKFYPSLCLDFADNDFETYSQIQNGWEQQPAHFLMAAALMNENKINYKVGQYDYFKIQIIVSDN